MTIEVDYIQFFKDSPYKAYILEGSLGLGVTFTENLLTVENHSKPIIGLSLETLKTAKIVLFDIDNKIFKIRFTQHDKVKMFEFAYQTYLAMGAV